MKYIFYNLHFLLFFISWQGSQKVFAQPVKNENTILHPYNALDTNYSIGFSYTIKDTVTSSGFSIRYLVSEATKYSDLYIVFSDQENADTLLLSGFFHIEDDDYVPVYQEETHDYLVLSHDCAAIECAALTFLDKNFKGKNFTLNSLNYENVQEGVFVYSYAKWDIPEKEYFIFDLFKMDTLKYVFETEVFLDFIYLQDDIVHIITYDSETYETAKKHEGIISLNRKP